MPRANAFYIASVPPPWVRKDMPALKNAVIRNPASSHPLMRDIVCRAIRHEIAELSRTYDSPGVPEFLQGLKPDADGVERTLLRQARLLLSPRGDDALALADAIEHDARVGVPAAPDRPA